MNAALFAIGAAMAALSVVFFARAGQAEPAAKRGALFAGILFILAGLCFIAAGAVATGEG